MFINQTMANEIYEDAGKLKLNRAKEFVKNKKVQIKQINYEDMNNFDMKGAVRGHYDIYNTYISVKNGELNSVECECEDYKTHYGACKHILASILEVDGNPKYNSESYEKQIKEKYTDFSDLINTFYDEEMKGIDDTEINQYESHEKKYKAST